MNFEKIPQSDYSSSLFNKEYGLTNYEIFKVYDERITNNTKYLEYLNMEIRNTYKYISILCVLYVLLCILFMISILAYILA